MVDAPSSSYEGDSVLPFVIPVLDVRGRVVSLSEGLTEILLRHAYPGSVSRVLGEAIALTALLGSALKFSGRLQLQTRSDGPVSMLVVDFESPDSVRAYARYDEEALQEAIRLGRAQPAALIGTGHLAFTIDQGSDMTRYQGLVALSGQGLEAAAHEYFLRSEQIPTRIRLAVAEEITAGGSIWRAGGIMVQFLPESLDRQRQRDLDPGDAPIGTQRDEQPEDNAWVEAKLLVDTVEDHELVDPMVPAERLVYRLFHEQGASLYQPLPIRPRCRCNRQRIEAMLGGFTREQRAEMIADDGGMVITCEFCSTRYALSPEDIDAL